MLSFNCTCKTLNFSFYILCLPSRRYLFFLIRNLKVLKSSTEDVDKKYMDYTNYHLSDGETRKLVGLCELFSMSLLEDKCFFRAPELCGDWNNRFLELSSKEVTFAAVRSVVVLGREAIVAKVMVFKDEWETKFYDNALYAVKRSLRPPSPTYTRRRSSSCIII